MLCGDRCIVMITLLAPRVKAGVAVTCHVIKRTVIGFIIEIVVIVIVVVIMIKWPLRCIAFCGVDDYKLDGAAQSWHLLQRTFSVLCEMCTLMWRGVEKTVQGPELPEKACPFSQANHEQHRSFSRSCPSQHVTDKLCSLRRQVRLSVPFA